MNALILGATGLVGHELLELLVMDKRFEKIDLLSRRELDMREITVTNHVVDFSNLTESHSFTAAEFAISFSIELLNEEPDDSIMADSHFCCI